MWEDEKSQIVRDSSSILVRRLNTETDNEEVSCSSDSANVRNARLEQS